MSNAASDLYFRQVPVGQMANFAYLVGSRSAREALVVDPAWAVDDLLDLAAGDDMRVTGALVTHYHPDHVGGRIMRFEIQGLARYIERNPSKVHVHDSEAAGVQQLTGISESDLTRHRGGDVLELGGIRITLLHTPGHTPGSQCFLVEEQGRGGSLVSGDTLFLGSCGRVDLPGSDPEAMYHSLNQTLRALPDDVRLYPGHMYASEPASTMGEQKRLNPYLRVSSLQQFLTFMGA